MHFARPGDDGFVFYVCAQCVANYDNPSKSTTAAPAAITSPIAAPATAPAAVVAPATPVTAPAASLASAGGAKPAAAAGGAAAAPQRKATATELVQVNGLFLTVCLFVAVVPCTELRSCHLLFLCLSYAL